MANKKRFPRSSQPVKRLVVWKDQARLDATAARLDAEAVASLRQALDEPIQDPRLLGALQKLGIGTTTVNASIAALLKQL